MAEECWGGGGVAPSAVCSDGGISEEEPGLSLTSTGHTHIHTHTNTHMKTDGLGCLQGQTHSFTLPQGPVPSLS